MGTRKSNRGNHWRKLSPVARCLLDTWLKHWREPPVLLPAQMRSRTQTPRELTLLVALLDDCRQQILNARKVLTGPRLRYRDAQRAAETLQREQEWLRGADAIMRFSWVCDQLGLNRHYAARQLWRGEGLCGNGSEASSV